MSEQNIQHDDLLNKESKVLLIGFGWVGQFCGNYFKEADYVQEEGVIVSRTGKEAYDHYDLAIISVPTPMDEKTGKCDISIVEEAIKRYKNLVDYFMCKSTVAVGTTDYLKKKYDVKICMSPEFLGETVGHPLIEPRRDIFLILGGEEKTINKVADFWTPVLNSNSKIYLCSSMEAELIKYCENYWITQRVDYWNDVYDLCATFKVSFMKVREGLLLDPRLGRTHSFVYPKNRGWSGKCLPKDMNALVYTAMENGLELQTLIHLIEKNWNYWRKKLNKTQRILPEAPCWKKIKNKK